MKIELYDLPKISLNQWYSGISWKTRKSQKDTFAFLVRSRCKHFFKKDKVYRVSYSFYFKSKPLDTSNCVGMLKMIEDVLFEDDTYKIIPELKIKSLKSNTDKVVLEVEELISNQTQTRLFGG